MLQIDNNERSCEHKLGLKEDEDLRKIIIEDPEIQFPNNTFRVD